MLSKENYEQQSINLFGVKTGQGKVLRQLKGFRNNKRDDSKVLDCRKINKSD